MSKRSPRDESTPPDPAGTPHRVDIGHDERKLASYALWCEVCNLPAVGLCPASSAQSYERRGPGYCSRCDYALTWA